MKIYKFGKIPTGSVQEMKGMLRLIDNSIPKIIRSVRHYRDYGTSGRNSCPSFQQRYRTGA